MILVVEGEQREVERAKKRLLEASCHAREGFGKASKRENNWKDLDIDNLMIKLEDLNNEVSINTVLSKS